MPAYEQCRTWVVNKLSRLYLRLSCVGLLVEHFLKLYMCLSSVGTACYACYSGYAREGVNGAPTESAFAQESDRQHVQWQLNQ